MGHALFACVVLALCGLFFAWRRSARHHGALRLAQAAILCGVVSGACAVALVGISLTGRGDASLRVECNEPDVWVSVLDHENRVVGSVSRSSPELSLRPGSYLVNILPNANKPQHVASVVLKSTSPFAPPERSLQNTGAGYALELPPGARTTLVVRMVLGPATTVSIA